MYSNFLPLPTKYQLRRQPVVRTATCVLALCMPLLAGSAYAQTETDATYDLKVEVSGLQSDTGQVIANLFMRGDDLFGKPHAKQILKSLDRQATLTFPKLKPGRYAVIAFHDVNGNNDLDHNMLKLPAEPLGYSNGFTFGLFSGMPSTDKLAFTLDAAHQSIHITVK